MDRVRDHCVRCGECCLKASPTLQVEDLHLVKKDLIGKKYLYTIRKGELVRDNVHEDLVVNKRELIKIRERERGKGGCIFYDDLGRACTIYENRPAQCSALKCWDTRDFVRIFKGPKLKRKDVVKDKVLLEMMAEHERRCGYAILEKQVKRIELDGEEAVEKILHMLKFDFQLRPFISEKLGLHASEMDFYFGRPLTETIAMFGLQVIREPDGSFLLTTLK